VKIVFPAIVLFTDNLPACSSGCANGPIIRIKPSHKDDKGIQAHELVHVRQWWRTFGFHSGLYLTRRCYRLHSEVEAYRKQLEYPHPLYTRDQLIDMYATWLSLPEPEGYDCHEICTKERAIELLGAGAAG